MFCRVASFSTDDLPAGISQAPQAAICPRLKTGSRQLAAVFDVIIATDPIQLNSTASESAWNFETDTN